MVSVKPQLLYFAGDGKNSGHGTKHNANGISLKLSCRAHAARATSQRCSFGVGLIMPVADAVRGSGMPRGQRVPCTST